MKKVLIGLCFLGFANLVHPQESDRGQKEIKLEGVSVSPINIDYLLHVHDNAVAERVLNLQHKVASFDLTKWPQYAGPGTYEMTFKQPEGKILAVFGRNGKIVQSYERFKNIIFPIAVRNGIYREYPGWTIENNTYVVWYTENRDAKKIFKVRLSKGELKKRIKIDASGNLLALAN